MWRVPSSENVICDFEILKDNSTEKKNANQKFKKTPSVQN